MVGRAERFDANKLNDEIMDDELDGDQTPGELPRAGEREVGTLDQMLEYAWTGKRSWIEPDLLTDDEQERKLHTLVTDDVYRRAFNTALKGQCP